LLFDFWNSTAPGFPSFPLSFASLIAVSTDESFLVVSLEHPFTLALKHDELDGRGHLVKPAEDPDKKDNRNWYTDQPEQKTSTHDFLLFGSFSTQRRLGSLSSTST
jgi:hypothetical protein